MTPEEYARLDATALSALIRNGGASRADVVAAARALIGERNPQLNAVIETYDPPLEDRTSDGPFAGVPFLMKDIGAGFAGKRATLGSRAFLNAPAQDHDDELSRRIIKAGFVVIGRTNIPELGFNVTTEPVAFGATRNPFDPSRTAGGSSGGAAAAVAAGLVPIAHATDGAGSIRIPAAACGLYGLKPSRGLLPQGPAYSDIYGGLVSEGVVTRTVRDTNAALRALAGADPGAPYAAPSLRRPTVKPLKIGVLMDNAADVTFAPEAMAAVQAAAAIFRALGHGVEELALPFTPQEWLIPRQAYRMQVCAQSAADFPVVPEGLEPLNHAAIAAGRSIAASEYLTVQRAGHDFARRFASTAWGQVDVVLTPALAFQPPPLGSFPMDHDDVALHVDRMTRFYPFAGLFNLTGGPALAMPAPRPPENLPVGIQIAADLGDDLVLLALAGDYEAALAAQGLI